MSSTKLFFKLQNGVAFSSVFIFNGNEIIPRIQAKRFIQINICILFNPNPVDFWRKRYSSCSGNQLHIYGNFLYQRVPIFVPPIIVRLLANY
ncbi:hypothetical protein ISO4_03232 [Alcanivorax venustensis ISO4]|uniref:Uncharacterized protein n=1 Tax=Alloalcanivorax venustensis ISO4 TaxID=1177184 RepID=A0ABS0AKR1_9GAMM|nr:hypothetical protein [Alloalcanivorax venustensis ISO4]